MKRKLAKTTGFSTIALVFIIASLSGLVILIMQLNALLVARQAYQVQNSQIAFFAAEGMMYQTIQRLKNNPDWPDTFPYTSKIQVGETDLVVTIDEDGGFLKIDITATTKGAKRRLVAEFKKGEEARKPLDVVLLIDHSGSMNDGGIDELGPHPFYEAQQAAIGFLDYLDNNFDRVGVVGYSEIVSETADHNDVLSLTSDYQNVENMILGYPIYDDASTNIATAVYRAAFMLENVGRADVNKVIIVLSDGVTNQSLDDACADYGYIGYPCLDWSPGNTNFPLLNPFLQPGPANPRVGTCCTDNAVDQAKKAKAKKLILFSIFLSNIDTSECVVDPNLPGSGIESVTQLGRGTLQQIAGDPDLYYETPDAQKLEEIYTEIAGKVTSPGFLRIKEEIPQPEPTLD